ncbi:probable NADH dehydrogenase [ubiquinone] 1 alpha subcomplex subunit 12 [Ostrinia nubilalis]|uniref:probable NADH dehydrogenase [ubiquinone] 1 alpha subcomplex subunit 12 n=1 Tax=Ostrinia furnacalis TaxID=93504 RepID=UPI00103CDDFD|nr:probable NADH dehydrogenase [ubiquinone] 1 alpha subcomplex subunit 12 [Ostrinia furnacalis]
MSLLALDKWAALVRIIAKNGGPFKALYKIWRYDTLKEGVLKGCDCFGNRYYENTYYMLGRSRWVEYADHVKWNYDASQVTAEWYGWLHYKTDCLPYEDCAKYCLNCCSWYSRWLLPHQENMSGTECAYYPFSTVRAHIKVWDGQSICNRPVC